MRKNDLDVSITAWFASMQLHSLATVYLTLTTNQQLFRYWLWTDQWDVAWCWNMLRRNELFSSRPSSLAVPHRLDWWSGGSGGQ